MGQTSITLIIAAAVLSTRSTWSTMASISSSSSTRKTLEELDSVDSQRLTRPAVGRQQQDTREPWQWRRRIRPHHGRQGLVDQHLLGRFDRAAPRQWQYIAWLVDGGLRSTPAKVMLSEVTSAGTEVSRVTINNITTFRLARRLSNGHTLITGDINNDSNWKVFEVDATGAIVWQQVLGGKGYVANRLANGETQATICQTDNKLLQLSPTGSIVKQWGGNANHPTAELRKFSGYSVVPATAISSSPIGWVTATSARVRTRWNSTPTTTWSGVGRTSLPPRPSPTFL